MLILSVQSFSAQTCHDTPLPRVWTVDSPYPFQAGAERSYDEMYHGPWKARREIPLYARPNGTSTIGHLKAGTVVEALFGRSINAPPTRLSSAADVQVQKAGPHNLPINEAMHKGDSFWLLDLTGEGCFQAWWHCHEVSWDSTLPNALSDEDDARLFRNPETRWIRIRIPGHAPAWISPANAQGEPNLIPARPTKKATG